MVTWAPILRASANRVALTSEAMTLAAPAARAMPTAKQPMGPHPTTSTVLPGISAESTVWNALPIGSITAPTVVGIPSSGRTLVAGIAMYSANAPSRSTPMMRVLRQMWLFPVRHWRQCPHTMCPSAVTSWPVLSSETASPTATISPANSCPNTMGGLMRPSAHAFQSAMCRSVPHTPAWRTAMRTSPGPGDGLGTDITVSPGARFCLTIACIRRGGRGRRSDDGACEAPVHLQYRARNIARPLRREERDGGRELLRPAHAAERDFRHHLAHDLLRCALLALGTGLRELRDPLRRDESGADDIDGDALGGDLVRQGLRETEDAGPGGRGQDQTGQRLLGRDGCEADDPTPLQLAHERHGGASEMHGGQEVQLDGAVEGLGGLLAERGRGGTARIAEQDVEAPELMVHTRHQSRGLRLDSHIGDERRDGLAGFGRQLARGLVNRALVAAVERDPCAFLRQRLRHPAADALGAAAHQRDAACET